MSKVGKMIKSSGPDWLFELSGHPIHWKKKSEELKFSAEILFREVQVDQKKFYEEVEKTRNDPNYVPVLEENKSSFWVYIFLCGLSIENLIKGIILFDNPELIMNGKIQGIITKHELLKLIKYADIELNQDEILFCEIATEAITSFGRYPVPKNSSHLTRQMTIKFSTKEIFEVLFEKLQVLFEKKLKNK